MVSITIFIAIVISVLSIVESDMNCVNSQRQYTRIKRAKYYSNPPQKFYKRHPMSYPVKGPFSYTPPPAYMMDEEPQYPPNYRPEYRPTKVSNTRSLRTEGLADDDISNIVKYLSKNDLDKIIEYAGEKGGNINSDNGYQNEYSRPQKSYSTKDINYDSNIPNGAGFNPSNSVEDQRASKIINSNYNRYKNQYQEVNSQQGAVNENYSNGKYNVIDNDNRESYQNVNSQDVFTQLDSKESMRYYQIYQPDNENFVNQNKVNSPVVNPLNVWQEEYAGSYTNNVPKVVEPSKEYKYKVENFGDLPLMNGHDSKLHTVSSYSVPRYTVTQSKPVSPPKSLSSSSYNIKVPPVEPAPSIEAAKEQSDAHLKAVKIWTHKSKGAEYYLHSDGRLTLETNGRPSYGQ